MSVYPDKLRLRFLEDHSKWEDLKGSGLIAFLNIIKETWNSDYGVFSLKGKNVLRLELHTGGWSGNEDIIQSLKENLTFWGMYWQRSDRGGHYYFKMKP